MAKIKITIIIVTFNSKEHIKTCINSIEKSYLEMSNYKIIVVDNNSNDRTLDEIAKLSIKNQDLKIIINSKNVGFAKAVNQGIKTREKSKYILLLNPDTVLNKNSLQQLLICAKKYNAGICGGSTMNIYNQPSGSHFRFPNLMVGLFDFTNLKKLFKNERWHKYFYYLDPSYNSLSSFPVDVITGGFMLIDENTLNKIGLFDESFFMYLEDVDYCLRAKKAGVKIIHSNESKILHIGGASSNNKDKIRHYSWLKSRKIYFWKNFGIIGNIIIQPIFILDDLVILLKKFISKWKSQ